VRIFLAGATGVIGRRLVPLLVADGHRVAGMTRSAHKVDALRSLGAEPVVCNVYDSAGLEAAVVSFQADTVLHELTDLPDDLDSVSHFSEANARIRREGTRNLLEAAPGARFIAESVAFDAGPAVGDLERMVPEHVRLPYLCGPGTYDPDCTGEGDRMHVDEAARLFAERLS
jgi:nucleoside-diphosphate-sugar epimerase